MYLHYFKSSAYIHFKGKQNNWLFAIGEVAQFFRTGGSRSPELWLILARIIQIISSNMINTVFLIYYSPSLFY